MVLGRESYIPGSVLDFLAERCLSLIVFRRGSHNVSVGTEWVLADHRCHDWTAASSALGFTPAHLVVKDSREMVYVVTDRKSKAAARFQKKSATGVPLDLSAFLEFRNRR